MNKLAIIILSTLILMTSGTALAQNLNGEPGRKGQRNERGIQSMPMVEQLMRAIKRLDLDDTQKENIRTIMNGLKEEVRPVLLEAKAGQLQLKDLIKAESYDEKAVAALAEKEGNLAAKRMILTSKALSDVFSHLTPEQRSELDAMAEKRMQRRGEKRKQRPAQS